MNLRDLEKLVLKRAVTWARSEPVLRSMTNGNLENRRAAEMRLAQAASNYGDALRAIKRNRSRSAV
jgi:hypothetical protein